MKMNRGDELLRPESLKQTTTFVGRGDIHSKSCERNISCFSSFYAKTNLTSRLQGADENREDVVGHEGVLRRREVVGGAQQGDHGGVGLLEGDLADVVKAGPYQVEALVYLRPELRQRVKTYMVKPQLAQISRMGWILAIIILSACADKS